MAAISLNGTSIARASDVQEDIEKIGVMLQAANGARRWAHRANKRTWTIPFLAVPLSTITFLRGIMALTTTFTFIDENGNSYTVFCAAGALTTSIPIKGSQSGSQVLFYDAQLTLTEA